MHQIKRDSKHNKGEAWEFGYQDKMIENEGEKLLRGVWILLHNDGSFSELRASAYNFN